MLVPSNAKVWQAAATLCSGAPKPADSGFSQSKKEGDDGDATEITLPVSHEELAQMAALSRAHTTVTMGKFRQPGVVRYKREQPVIVDVQALAKC